MWIDGIVFSLQDFMHCLFDCKTMNYIYLIFDFRTYGIYAPWITIAVVGSISAALLLYDWKRDRKCFSHVTQPKELIRSETTEQMKKR